MTFTLNNPAEGNKVTGKMLEAMLVELHAETIQPRRRILRVRAAGNVFCTGRERAGRTAAAIRKESARILAFKRALRTSPLIAIAEVQGNALGFGFGLAILCDFALVAEHALLGFPEMRSGLAPAAIMAYLGEYALPKFAFPMVLLGELINAQRALDIGLVSRICPASQLRLEADALIDRILKLDTGAVRRCKQFFVTAQQNLFDKNCRLAIDSLTAGSLALLAKENASLRDH